MATAAKRTRQRYQETDLERQTRVQAGFPELEDTMPLLSSRLSCSLIDRLTSYLGPRNPLCHLVDSEKDSVWLLDNTAYLSTPLTTAAGQHWQAEFVAAYFVKNSGKDVSRIVADLSEKMALEQGDLAEATIRERVQPFVDSILPAHSVYVQIGDGKATKRLGPSDRNGISSDLVCFTGNYTDGQTITSQAIGMQSATPLTTTFAAPTGWAVISDIDDTIKRTMTASPIGILRTTFVETPQPIAGMPELYAHIKWRLSAPPFWYLSASPYNLYPFLREFREEHYPPGTIILRESSWMNLAGILTSLTQGTQAYKVDRMEKIHRWFPGRKFVCVGDSTQSDPEAYGEIYRRHPGWIGAIFIRKVMDIPDLDESGKNKNERFEKALEGVPRDVWHVFTDPAELYERVNQLPKMRSSKALRWVG